MIYDLIVIGGGPAGMMTAGRASENGALVLLLEKRDRLGMKLGITGKGRCNITNAEFDIKKLIQNYGQKGKFLFSAFSCFSPKDVIDFFNKLKVETKIERGNRVFPKSDKSIDIILAFKKYLIKNKVEIKYNAVVADIEFQKDKIIKVILADGREFVAKNYCIATGGKSYEATGSTGDGYKFAKKMGHKIILPTPAIVPILVKESFVKELEGLSLKNVEISLWQNNKKQDSRFGEALFTDSGMSGPVILDMSKKVGELLKSGVVLLKIDFKPALQEKELGERIQSDFKSFHNKMFKNSLDKLLPQKLIPVIIKLSEIKPDKKPSEITRPERKKLLLLLKNFTLQVSKLDSFEHAIITSGGVDLSEVDPKTCRSKIILNLFFAGEILDLDGPTGGFNLQIAWSTGFVVGESMKKF